MELSQKYPTSFVIEGEMRKLLNFPWSLPPYCCNPLLSLPSLYSQKIHTEKNTQPLPPKDGSQVPCEGLHNCVLFRWKRRMGMVSFVVWCWCDGVSFFGWLVCFFVWLIFWFVFNWAESLGLAPSCKQWLRLWCFLCNILNRHEPGGFITWAVFQCNTWYVSTSHWKQTATLQRLKLRDVTSAEDAPAASS